MLALDMIGVARTQNVHGQNSMSDSQVLELPSEVVRNATSTVFDVLVNACQSQEGWRNDQSLGVTQGKLCSVFSKGLSPGLLSELAGSG